MMNQKKLIVESSIEIHRKKKEFHWFARGLPLILVAGILVGTVVMYLTATTSSAKNVFRLGGNTVQIIEPGIDPDAVEWGADTKPVKLKNPDHEDSAPEVVRVMLIPYLVDAIGGSRIGGNLSGLAAPAGNTLELGDLTFHFASDWSSKWFYKDGFFYYRQVLEKGDETSLLLTGVTLASGKEKDYQDISVKIDVLADGLQVEGNAPAVEWGVTVSNNVVSP